MSIDVWTIESVYEGGASSRARLRRAFPHNAARCSARLSLIVRGPMPTTPLDRLTFAQGGLCFFCCAPLPKADASVEHLVPIARSGSNSDDNCVVCCKAMNALLGSMSLKEKIKVVLNQKGAFTCPNGTAQKTKDPSPPRKPNVLSLVIDNLKSRGTARPRKTKTLASTIKSLGLGLTDAQVSETIEQLRKLGKITVSETGVTYQL